MKPTAVLSWIVILIVALGIPIVGAIRAQAKLDEPTAASTSGPAETLDFQFEILGKSTYAISQSVSPWKPQLIKQMNDAAKTPLQQAAAAVVVAELDGAEAIRAPLAANGSTEALALSDWYFEHSPLPADVVERLGWYGQLAATSGQVDDAPARKPVIDSARKVMITIGSVYGLILVAGFVGFCLLITAIVLLAMGKIRFRVGAPDGPSHVYVEAFALYLSSYLLGSIVVNLYFRDAPMGFHMVPLVFGVALAAVWPMLRGARFATVRTDWGIHAGTNPIVEAFFGVLGYLAGLPLIAAAALVTVVLVKLSGTQPTHPIMSEIAEHPWLIFLLAVVFAPLTEELLFRGALVSHLRAGVGVVLSALISGLIFAAIHPQGWTLIPVLAGIGAVLAIIRQWRGTLISSITAHALHNGILVTLMILLMG
jgi:membrane protease YdiL (CAAX protease family)